MKTEGWAWACLYSSSSAISSMAEAPCRVLLQSTPSISSLLVFASPHIPSASLALQIVVKLLSS